MCGAHLGLAATDVRGADINDAVSTLEVAQREAKVEAASAEDSADILLRLFAGHDEPEPAPGVVNGVLAGARLGHVAAPATRGVGAEPVVCSTRRSDEGGGGGGGTW